jgi:hypothetical protein
MKIWNTVETTAYLIDRKAKVPTWRIKYSSATSSTINPTQTGLTLYRLIFNNILNCWGYAVAQWLRHCATNRKVAGLIPDGVTGVFY